MHPATAKMIRDKFATILANLHEWSAKCQTCKRKNVGTALVDVLSDGYVQELCRTFNGGEHCTNEVGNCGCGHSEPRTIMMALKMGYHEVGAFSSDHKRILLSTYSPCTSCANVILDSGIVFACVFDILTEHDQRGANMLKRLPGGIVGTEITDEFIQAWFQPPYARSAT